MSTCRQICVMVLLVWTAALVTPAAAAPRPMPTPAPSVEVGRKVSPIHVDGKLDEEAWALLEPVSYTHLRAHETF